MSLDLFISNKKIINNILKTNGNKLLEQNLKLTARVWDWVEESWEWNVTWNEKCYKGLI